MRLRYWRTWFKSSSSQTAKPIFHIFPYNRISFELCLWLCWPWIFDWFMRCWLKTANNDKLRFDWNRAKRWSLSGSGELAKRRKVLRILARLRDDGYRRECVVRATPKIDTTLITRNWKEKKKLKKREKSERLIKCWFYRYCSSSRASSLVSIQRHSSRWRQKAIGMRRFLGN